MADLLSPYRESYGKHVVKHYIHLQPPLDGFADDKLLSENFKLGEIRKASFIIPEERNLFAYIPLDSRVLQAAQILRDALGKPINVNSSFRSVRHEKSKKRKGTSQHTHGKALDLSGSGLVELLKEALETKNKLYQRLRAVGVNGFGIYVEKDFVHIDVRDANSDGGYEVWYKGEEGESNSDEKKNLNTILRPILTLVSFVMIAVGIFKKVKKRKK